MRKKRSDRIGKLVDLARVEERRECEEVGRLQRALDHESRRLGELRSYRSDYAKRFNTDAVVSAAKWQDYQNFLRRIDRAVCDLEQQIGVARNACDARRRRWLDKRRKRESLERVVERYSRAERDADERLQQKMQDDMATRGIGSWNRSGD